MVYKKLLQIQTGLKAPKSQYNKFGNYNYRNCEDILEALKPLLKELNTVIVITDDIIFLEGRFYIKATAKLIDIEDGTSIENVAFAREEESKKGMDASQVTGASSTYARKYALNGLFTIDDTKDSDTTNNTNRDENGEKKQKQAIKSTPRNNTVVCPKCGGEMKENITMKTGNVISPEEFISRYGMCDKCKKKEKENLKNAGSDCSRENKDVIQKVS